jgi:hypothetical protein
METNIKCKHPLLKEDDTFARKALEFAIDRYFFILTFIIPAIDQCTHEIDKDSLEKFLVLICADSDPDDWGNGNNRTDDLNMMIAVLFSTFVGVTPTIAHERAKGLILAPFGLITQHQSTELYTLIEEDAISDKNILAERVQTILNNY